MCAIKRISLEATNQDELLVSFMNLFDLLAFWH